MRDWYRTVVANPNNPEVLAQVIAHYINEYNDGLDELKPIGRLESYAQKLPGLMTYRYGQWTEINKIVDYMKIREKKVLLDAVKRLLKTYNRTLSDRDAEKYASVEDDVIDQRMLTLEMEEVKAKFEGLTKGIEQLHYQIRNIVELRKAGIEEAEFLFTS
jgi:hypothetical protein